MRLAPRLMAVRHLTDHARSAAARLRALLRFHVPVEHARAVQAAKRGNVRHLRVFSCWNMCHVVCSVAAVLAVIIVGSSTVSCACDEGCVASSFALTASRFPPEADYPSPVDPTVNASRMLRWRSDEAADAGAAPALDAEVSVTHGHKRRHHRGSFASLAHFVSKALKHSSAGWAVPHPPHRAGGHRECPWAALRAHAAALNMTWLVPHNGSAHGHHVHGKHRHGGLWAALAKLAKDMPQKGVTEEAMPPAMLDEGAAPVMEKEEVIAPVTAFQDASEVVPDVDSSPEFPEEVEPSEEVESQDLIASEGEDRRLRGNGDWNEQRHRDGPASRLDGSHGKIRPEDARKYEKVHAEEENEQEDDDAPNGFGRDMLFGFLNDRHHRKEAMTKAEFVRASQRTCDAGPGVIILILSVVLLQMALHYAAAKAARALAAHPWTQAMYAASCNAAAAARSTSGFVPPAGAAPDPNTTYRFVPGHGFVPESGVPTAVIPIATPAPVPMPQQHSGVTSLRDEARAQWHAGRQWLRSMLSRGGRYERVGAEDPSTDVELPQVNAPQQQHSFVHTAAPSMYAVPHGYAQQGQHMPAGAAAAYATPMPPPMAPAQPAPAAGYPAGSPYTYAIMPQGQLRI